MGGIGKTKNGDSRNVLSERSETHSLACEIFEIDLTVVNRISLERFCSLCIHVTASFRKCDI